MKKTPGTRFNSKSGPVASESYRAEIDGLRAFSVIAVAGFHAFPEWLGGGFIGVDVFFVISGFLITGLLLQSPLGGMASLRDFYLRRIRRIFPALLLVLAAVLAMGTWVMFHKELRSLAKTAAATAAFLPNLALYLEIGYFHDEADRKPLLHLWTIGVEEQFYLAWPVVVHFCKLNARRLAATTAILAAGSLLVAYWSRFDATWAYYGPHTRAWEFLAGAALAQWRGARPGQGSAVSTRFGNALSLAGVAIIAVSTFAWGDRNGLHGVWLLVPVAAAVAILAAGPKAILNRSLLASPALVKLGLISFPFYLWHWPCLSYARILVGGTPGIPIRIGCLVLALILAQATYTWLEQPIRRGRWKETAPRALMVSMAFVFVAGIGIYLLDGFPGREFNSPFQSASTQIFGKTLPYDPICAESLHSVRAKEEVCLASSDRPEVLFLGDSHAMALYSAIDAGVSTIAGVLAAGGGCELFPGLAISPARAAAHGAACADIAADGLGIAARNASIRTVVLVYRSRPVEKGIGSDYSRDGKPLDMETAFLEGHGSIIDSLLRLGKHVVFVIDVPTFRFHPADCEVRLPFLATRDCSVDLAAHELDNVAYRAAVGRLRERYPSISVFDPTKAFCGPVRCSAKHSGIWNYRDEDHLNPVGSMAVLSLMRERGIPGI